MLVPQVESAMFGQLSLLSYRCCPCLKETPAVLVAGILWCVIRFHVHRSKSSEIEYRFSWELIDHASIFFSLRASQSLVFLLLLLVALCSWFHRLLRASDFYS